MQDERINWYRVDIDKAVMKKLMERSDLRGLLQCVPQLLIVVLTGWLCHYSYHHWAWPLTLLVFFIHGTFFSFLGPTAAIHELSHGTPFKTKALNEFFMYLFGFLTWTNPIHFRVSHARHHQNTLHSVIDQEVELPIRVGWRKVLWSFTIGPAYTPAGTWLLGKMKYHIVNALGRLNNDWEHRLFDDSPAKRAQLFNFARILILGHVVLIAWFLYIDQWILIPIAALPFYAAWLVMLCETPQHAGLQGDVPDFRRSCRTVLQGPFLRYWYWNMNHHIEHHMYAGVPFHALPKLQKELAYDMPVPNRGLVSAWKEIIETQKRQKTDPDYCFDNFSRKDG